MNLQSLPAVVKRGIPGAQLPANYEAAKRALAECVRVDECKNWSDRATAIHTYAKQVGDTSLMDFAAKIRARAVRRLGELLQEEYPKKYGKEIERATGISAARAASARRLAAVPEPVFETALCQKPVPGPRTIYTQHESAEYRKSMQEEPSSEREAERSVDARLMDRVSSAMGQIECYGTPQDLATLVLHEGYSSEWMDFSDYVARVAALVSPRRT